MNAAKTRSASLLRVSMITLVLLMVIALATVLWRKPGGSEPNLSAQLQLTRSALVKTENRQDREAGEIWDQLFELASSREGDTNLQSIALNRALNRALQVDALAERINNSNLSNDARNSARQAMPPAIALARQSIDDLESIADLPSVTLWLRSRIEIREIDSLPPAMQRRPRRAVFTRLVEAINDADMGDDAGVAVLGGLLAQSVERLQDPVEGLPVELQGEAAGAFARLSDLHPSNLYFALLAARATAESGDAAEAARYVQRTWDLVRAVAPTLEASTRSMGMSPQEMVDQITRDLESGAADSANRGIRQWFNAVNATELAKTDRRRSNPHPIDLLSFSSLRELSAKMAALDPPAENHAPLQFVPQEVFPRPESAAIRFVEPIDFDLDLDSDLLAVDDAGTITLHRNDGRGRWSQAASLTLDTVPQGMIIADLFVVDATNPAKLQAATGSRESDLDGAEAVGDRRHNTFPTALLYGTDGIRQLAIDGRQRASGPDRLRLIQGPTGLESVIGTTSMIAGDLEGDGDLDLVIGTENDGVRMFVNRGDRTFFELDAPLAPGAGPDGPVVAMAISDLDRDLDLDVITVTGKTGRVGIVENLLHLQFRYRPIHDVPKVTGATQVEVTELDGNLSWDIVVGGNDQALAIVSKTPAAGVWSAETTATVAGDFNGFALADFDNDSWAELIGRGVGGAAVFQIAPQVQAQPNELSFTFESGSIRRADFNQDGRIDLAYVSDGTAMLALNETRTSGHFLRVRFRGIDDNATGRVNHFAIGSVLELRFGPHYRSQIITSPVTHFGLDGYEDPSSLRVIFPNGFTQWIRDPEVDTLIEEKQELKGSCPYLYGWDGERFAFVTDCLWAAPLGLQVAAGVVAPDRPWEYLKVDGRYVKPKDGAYELRITEELWEVVYLDHVSLQAIDHPADVDIWTNEKVGPPELAEPKIFAFGRNHRLTLDSATDTSGRDVTERLKATDDDYVQGFDRRIRQGLCPPHWVDLDFGTVASESDERERVYLVLTGWILPTDTSLNIQIDQNPELPAIEFPSIWVPDPEQADGWQKAIPYTGFPGGKTKTIVVDVTDVIDRRDARLRVRTSAQIYWDAAELAIQSSPPSVRKYPLDLIAASLHPHGFSQRVERGRNRPESYRYERATQSPRWPPLSGLLTRYGECRGLIANWDDAMVVMGGGDEVRLKFSLPEVPTPEGWKRDFVLHCVGWDKDADLNTLAGQSSDPLPFREMKSYPPNPIDGGQKRVNELNEWHRTRHQSFREFWSRPVAAAP